MRALTLVADRELEARRHARRRPPPGAGEVQIRVTAVALNHIDVWGWRGMAFAKRKLPLVVGAEAAGEIAAVGPGVTAFKAGDPVVMYGALTCGTCKACREGRDNLCENVTGVMGFHVDGFARDLVNMPERLVIPVPDGRQLPRRRLRADRLLAPCSTCCSTTPSWSRRDDPGAGRRIRYRHRRDQDGQGDRLHRDHHRRRRREGREGAGARRRSRHQLPHRPLRRRRCASSPARRASTSCSSMSARTRSTARCCASSAAAGWSPAARPRAPSTTINLMQLFQQQYRIIGSFGASMRNIRESLDKMAAGMLPVIDTEVPLDELRAAAWHGWRAGRCSARSS